VVFLPFTTELSTALGMLPLMTFVPVEGDASREYVAAFRQNALQRETDSRQSPAAHRPLPRGRRCPGWPETSAPRARLWDAAADDLCAGGR
jgi:hypothetical protein